MATQSRPALKGFDHGLGPSVVGVNRRVVMAARPTTERMPQPRFEQHAPEVQRCCKVGEWGSNDLLTSDVLRRHELRVWLLSEHLVDEPLVDGEDGT